MALLGYHPPKIKQMGHQSGVVIAKIVKITVSNPAAPDLHFNVCRVCPSTSCMTSTINHSPFHHTHMALQVQSPTPSRASHALEALRQVRCVDLF